MTKLKLFIVTFLITTALASTAIYVKRDKPPVSTLRLVPVTEDLFITSQLQLASIPELKARGINTIVDIRPDGEATDQVPSSDMERAAHASNLGFGYIPVPHEYIPDNAVEALGMVLAQDRKPAVLYCRTGRRAVRLLALVEASRANGPAMDSILQMVSSAGFSADDLREAIAQRISKRTAAK